MALQIKNNGPDDDEPSREYYGSSWQESTTAREPSESEEPEFNPEAEFDTFKVPKGVEKAEQTVTSYMDPSYHNSESVATKDKTMENLKKTLIGLLVLAILVIVGKIIFFPTPKDLTDSAKLSEEELASKFHITFQRDETMDKYIPQWTNGSTIEAKTGKGLTVYSVDGVYSGFHFDTKKWTVYGLKVGMAVQDIDGAITFNYEDSFMVLNDVLGGNSSADYYYNTATNEMLTVTISDRTGRIAAISYTNNFRKVTENLSF